MWLELTSEADEKIYVNATQLIVIYPVDEHKLTRILTAGGPITIQEPIAFLQAKLEGAIGKQ
ncbi:hypothetical protein [Pararhizobium sp. DWP3-4]|uniref:hypothetical protein n=1 Tax=Pararhizobium sp. DWP3-4 TaxID=2804565 RepID=UPI003CED9DB1